MPNQHNAQDGIKFLNELIQQRLQLRRELGIDDRVVEIDLRRLNNWEFNHYERETPYQPHREIIEAGGATPLPMDVEIKYIKPRSADFLSTDTYNTDYEGYRIGVQRKLQRKADLGGERTSYHFRMYRNPTGDDRAKQRKEADLVVVDTFEYSYMNEWLMGFVTRNNPIPLETGMYNDQIKALFEYIERGKRPQLEKSK